MDSSEIRAKVRCSACHGKLSRTLNMVDLGRKATWEHPTVGNVLTGEQGGAMAIVCNRCLKTPRVDLKEAVEFTEDGGVVYHPVQELAKVQR